MSKTLPFTGSGVAIITPFDGLKTIMMNLEN